MLQWIQSKRRSYYLSLVALGVALLVSACGGGSSSGVTSKAEVSRVVMDFVHGYRDGDANRVSRTLASRVRTRLDLGHGYELDADVSRAALMQTLEDFWREYDMTTQEFKDPLISVEGSRATAVGEYRHTIVDKNDPDRQCSMETTAVFSLLRVGGSSSWEIVGVDLGMASKVCVL